MPKPLAGLRVLELARILAGPWAGQTLAKRSDVLIENFKVGGLAKFGLDYKSLASENPRLIYCSVTGFGQDGPDAKRAGYDLMAQGMGGLMDLTGFADGPPTRVGVAISDIFTGCYSVIGILAALAQREKTGMGCYVDTALVDSTVGVLANQGLNYLVSKEIPKRIGNSHPNIVPYQEFPVADGHIIIATGTDNQFVKLCHVLGAPELAETPAYKNNIGRLTHRTELVVGAGSDDDVAIGDREFLVGHDVGMRIADALGDFFRDEIIEPLIGQHADGRIHQRGIDVTALAGLLALRQRGQDADHRIAAGEDVGDRHADAGRRPVREAGQVHQAAHALRHEIVAGALGVGAVLSESGH